MTHDLTQPPAFGDLVLEGNAGPVIVTAAAMPTDEQLDSWQLNGHPIISSPDRAYLTGRYLHTGEPANSNGHIFRHDQIEKRHLGIAGAPLDMLHDRRRIVGAFLGSRLHTPDAAATAASASPYAASPVVNTIAAVWSYYFPDDAREIRIAHEAGLAFLSMSCVPQTATCARCGLNAPWRGYTSTAYCAHMQGTKPKWLENPVFVGGAAIVPPTRPGWADALIRRYAGFFDDHPELTQTIYDQLAAAAAATPTQHQLESLAAQIVEVAYGPAAAGDPATVVAAMWDATAHLYPGVDFTPPAAVAAAAAPATAPDPTTAARARALAAAVPVPAEGVPKLVDDTEPGAATAAALGGATTHRWATSTYTAMLRAEAQHPDADQSAMVALYPADPVALEVDGGDTADQLHLTIAYLGKISDLTDEALTRAAKALVAGQSATSAAVEARVSGIGTLGDEGAVVLYVQGEAITAIHDAVWEAIGTEGYHQRHATFIAHISLGYGKTPEAVTALFAAGQRHVGTTIGLDRIGLQQGDQMLAALPLGST